MSPRTRAVLFDFGETLVEWVSDEHIPLIAQTVTVFPDARSALDRLREGGLHMGIVSNTTQSSGAEMRSVLRRIGVEDCFDVVVTSFDLGVEKPDPRIFRHAMDLLGSAPQHTAMVGNDLVADIGGAAGLGMVTVLVARGGSPDLRVGPAPTFVVGALRDVPDVLLHGAAPEAAP